MNEKKVAVPVSSNNKNVKFKINQSNGCIDRQRNALRGRLIKVLVEKELMVEGEKFGKLELPNKQQVSALLRKLRPIVKSYVEEKTEDYDRQELWNLQNEKTQKALGTPEAITNELIEEQHMSYFKDTLSKKVKG